MTNHRKTKWGGPVQWLVLALLGLAAAWAVLSVLFSMARDLDVVHPRPPRNEGHAIPEKPTAGTAGSQGGRVGLPLPGARRSVGFPYISAEAV